MKFTVEVNLEEFFSDDDETSFSEKIKNYICQQVQYDIYKEWGKQIGEQIKETVKLIVSEEKENVIKEMIMSALSTNKIKKSSYSSDMITIEEHIQEVLNNTYNIDSRFEREIKNILEQKSKIFIGQLQERYDVAFATQIVIKLNENKMLKEDVASLLLGSQNEK